MIKHRRLLLLLISLLTLTLSLQAQNYFIPKSEIEKNGINYKLLNPIALSYNGDYFIATQMVQDLQDKARGFAYMLLTFRFEDGRLAQVDKVLLPITHLVNVAYAPRGEMVMVSGNHGNKLLLVSVRAQKYKVIFEYEKGKPGFKGGEMLISHKGRFYSTGWFYDENQYWQGDYLVGIGMDKEGKARFMKSVNLETLFNERFKDIGFTRSFYYVSGDQLFFNIIKPEQRNTSLMMYKKMKGRAQGEVFEVDQGHLISVFVGTEDRVFYIVTDEEKNYYHYVKDVSVNPENKDIQMNKRWQIGEKGDLFSYPFLVNRTLVVIKMNINNKTFNGYFARENENYRIRRFLKNEPLGPMKISGNGRHYLLYSIEGFKVGELN